MAQSVDFQNILVIHFGQLGDVVLGLPALRAVRERFSDAKITLLIGKSAVEIAKLARVADEYIAIDRVELRDGSKFRSIADVGRIVRDIRRPRFDFVIDLHSLSETNLLGIVAGIPNRLYANRENRSYDSLSNFRPRPPLEDKAKHLSQRYFDVLLPLEISAPKTPFVLEPLSQDLVLISTKFPDVFSRPDSKLAGLFPGAGHPSRCWPLENFATLAAKLAVKNIRPVVFLGPEETALKISIQNTFHEETFIVDGLNLPQFVAAASQMAVFVANDTGPVHLAAIAGVPIVLLLDGRAPTTYLPMTDEMTVVSGQTIDQIVVDEVFSATVERMTNRSAA